MISVSSLENMEQKKMSCSIDLDSSIDLHLLKNVVVMKVVFPVSFIQVKQ